MWLYLRSKTRSGNSSLCAVLIYSYLGLVFTYVAIFFYNLTFSMQILTDIKVTETRVFGKLWPINGETEPKLCWFEPF